MNPAIKPCPKCGAKGELIEIVDGNAASYKVGCSAECDGSFETPLEREFKAITIWNEYVRMFLWKAKK